MDRKVILAAVMVIGLLSSRPAHADWLFTPFAGGNLGGNTVHTQPNFGVSAGWMGANVIGFEVDAAWAPDFFDSGEEAAAALLSDSSLSTLMVNVIVGAPADGQTGAGVRPYVSAGLGAMMTRVESDLGLVDVDETDVGWNVGAGAIGFFNDRVGLRGDARYLQALRQTDDAAGASPVTFDSGRFSFWRLTGGVVFRWR